MPTAHEFARAHAARFEAELIDLLRIPSVSTQPDHAIDVERAAEWLAANLRRIGMARVTIDREEGCHPLVYGEVRSPLPDAPTVLVYCHYDVQPAALEDGWDSDPFQPLERGGRIYARGAVDSKSHVVAWLKAAESLLAVDAPCPVSLKLLFEGEEETDSAHIFRFVAANQALLAADAVVVSDGSMPDENQPVLDYGLRGILEMELTVSGPRRDLHSGHYGGTVHNPIQALAEILAQLHDADGRVTVPGFYDHVPPLTQAERDVLAAGQRWVEAAWQAVAGAPQPWGEPDYALHERIGLRPTLEMNGISGGYTGPGFKTVIPARAKARLSCRLVPGQDPARIFELVRDHIAALVPPTVHASLRRAGMGAPGVLLDREGPAMQAAVRAYEHAWGVTPIFTREGGSVPVVDVFLRELRAPLVLMPFGYKGGGAHGPNEYVVRHMFHKGIAAAIHFAQTFAALHSADRGADCGADPA
ncbi:MAG: dipeptidase [Anaerolineae bacterium]|nr:dipeptidase [Anaerolineae bacterium]